MIFFHGPFPVNKILKEGNRKKMFFVIIMLIKTQIIFKRSKTQTSILNLFDLEYSQFYL